MRKLILIFAFFASMSAFAQGSIDDLNANLKKSQLEIERLENQLKSNQALQKDKLTQKKLLDAKVVAREKFVRQLDGQIDNIKREMGSLADVVMTHNKRFDSLNAVRDKLYRKAYKELSKSELSAGLGSQKYIKVELNRVVEMLKKEAENVDSLKKILGVKYEKLMEQSEEVAKLFKAKNTEVTSLKKERILIDALNEQLKKDEQYIRQSAENERVKLQNLQSQIASIVATEAGTGAKVLMGTMFGDNKGKLPAPLVGFLIEDSFGLHDHPTKKGIKIKNTGVNLRSTVDSRVLSVFEGEVRGIFLVDGMGSSVMIRHGDYFTVYSNLEKVTVAKGQVVHLGQQIGKLGDSNKLLHFEVWKGTENLNPQSWINLR